MTDRCWRKTISNPAVGMDREQYPTDNVGVNENFVLPSMTSAFQVTIPDNRFAQGSGGFVLAIFKVRATYVFSQRRTDINDLVSEVRNRVVDAATAPVRFGPVKTGA